LICVWCCYKFKLLIVFYIYIFILFYLFIYLFYLFFYSFMILLLFYKMKLLAFIGDFFTPMLPLLLFFLSSLHYSLLLCPAPLFCFFFFL
ncbi:hypothetical protein PPACK8108_LOCUS23061, partial [Phakopsora pachyrhizi]